MSEGEVGPNCPDETIVALVAMLQQDEPAGIAELRNLVARFEGDARLHFLQGSMMAGHKDYAAARAAMRRAIDIAPDFAIARFQLGFLQLTSGEAWPAQETWGPLHGLAERHYLRFFVDGLCHLIRDEFAEAISKLEQGIAANDENLPLNKDMSLVLDEMRREGMSGGQGEMSSAQMLLQQASLRSTRH